MSDPIEDTIVLQDKAEQNYKAAQELHKRVVRAKSMVGNGMLPMKDDFNITVSVKWLNWMLDFVEGDGDL